MSTRLENAGKAYRSALSQTKAQSVELANTAKDRTTGAIQRAANDVGENPIRYVAVGAFIGALAGAFLPKSKTEDAAIAEAGRFFSDTVQKIADGAIDALASKD